jgi:hypothetical protein
LARFFVLQASTPKLEFLAFSESDDGYHNELYGYIESEGWLSDFKNGKTNRAYKKEWKGNVSEIQIYHPENTYNQRFTTQELGQSISEMRTFIVGKQNA